MASPYPASRVELLGQEWEVQWGNGLASVVTPRCSCDPKPLGRQRCPRCHLFGHREFLFLPMVAHEFRGRIESFIGEEGANPLECAMVAAALWAEAVALEAEAVP